MRQEILSVSRAKAKLLQLVRAMEEEGRAFILTKDGSPVGVMIPIEEYEAFVETGDIKKSDALMRDLKEALADERKGRLWKRAHDGRWVRAKQR